MSKSIMFPMIDGAVFPDPLMDERAVFVAMINTATLIRRCGEPKAAGTAARIEIICRELLLRFDARSEQRPLVNKPEAIESAQLASLCEPLAETGK